MHVFSSWSNPGVVVNAGCLYTVLLTVLRITTKGLNDVSTSMVATENPLDTTKL